VLLVLRVLRVLRESGSLKVPVLHAHDFLRS
jgi:hypothetical protein